MFREAAHAIFSVCALLSAPALAEPAPRAPAILRERAMVPPAPLQPAAAAVNANWVEAVLPDLAYDEKAVGDPARYRVRSADDAAFSRGVAPDAVDHRHWPESATYADAPGRDIARIIVVYRIFLRLPVALTAGKTYQLEIAPAVARTGALSFVFDGAAPNPALHVNQVAYRPGDAKVAYLSAWTGAHAVLFDSAPKFEVIDEEHGKPAFSGPVRLEVPAEQERWSRSNVYALDFSALGAEGRFHLHVPGVGRSFSFRIEAAAYNHVAYTLVRGLALQRDGDHGLTAAVTHWHRPPAHLDDAVDQRTGARVDLTGGHMDAGDRGKYPWDAADAAAALVLAIDLFPREVQALGESLQLANSHNGVPDLIDEAAWELDWLAKVVQNPAGDGAVAFYLRPRDGGYEQGAPLEGAPGRVYFDKTHGPNRAETLYAAGALAMAASSPQFQKYLPEKCKLYRRAALRAFAAFELHEDDEDYWRDAGWYDSPAKPHKWSDELLVASAALLRLTGEPKYAAWVRESFPQDPLATKQWGWKVDVPWLIGYALIARLDDPRIGVLPERAVQAVLKLGDAVFGDGRVRYDAPFGAPLPWPVNQRVGWYFTASASAFPLMVAYGITGETHYREALVRDWNWILGANPLSRTFVSGLGDPQRSPRWMVHEIAQVMWSRFRRGLPGGWSEPPPGLLSADLQAGRFSAFLKDNTNGPRRELKFPAHDAAYPALYRYQDAWTVENEATINRQARAAVSVLPLLELTRVVAR